MTTSVRLNALRASTEIGLDVPTRFQSTLTNKGGDSSPLPTESDFHKILRQGARFSDDEDETASRDSGDNAPASHDQGNTGSDSSYLLSSPIALAPSRPVARVDVEPESTEAAPETATRILPLGAALPPTRSVVALKHWSAGSASAPPQESTVGSATPSPTNIRWSRATVPPVSELPRSTHNTGFRATEEQLVGLKPEKSTSSASTTSNTGNVLPAWSSGSTGFHSHVDRETADRPSAQPAAAAPPSQPTGDPKDSVQLQSPRLQPLAEQMPDSADLPALLLNINDVASAEKTSQLTTPSVLADLVSQLADLPPAEVAHVSPRALSNTSIQPPPPSTDLAPTPESLSLSPAPATADDSSSNAQSQIEPTKGSRSGQVNAPVEWSIDNDELRTGAAGSNSPDPVAFEAKLTPEPVAPAPSLPITDNLPPLAPAASRFLAATPDEINGAPELKPETLFKTELSAPVSSATPLQTETRPAQTTQPDAPVATQMQPMIEAPVAPSGHAVTVNVRETADEAGVNLRFVERGGEIHVSVRTSDVQLAQDMRGGLNDLASRLEHAGIRTEISNLSAGESNTQRDAQQPPAEHKGSGRQPQDSQREQQESRKNNPSGWHQAILDSTGENAHLTQEQNT
jgi:hypothetical protein